LEHAALSAKGVRTHTATGIDPEIDGRKDVSDMRARIVDQSAASRSSVILFHALHVFTTSLRASVVLCAKVVSWKTMENGTTLEKSGVFSAITSSARPQGQCFTRRCNVPMYPVHLLIAFCLLGNVVQFAKVAKTAQGFGIVKETCM